MLKGDNYWESVFYFHHVCPALLITVSEASHWPFIGIVIINTPNPESTKN